jgi:hypothetical protein
MGFWNNFAERIKFSRITRKSLEPKPNIVGLAVDIFENAQKSSDLLDEYLSRSFSKGSQEYLNKRVNLFFEIASFLAHFASRITFKKFGPQKRQVLNNYLGPLLVEYTVSHFYASISEDSPKNPPEGFKQYFYNYLNASEREYGSCKSWILRQEEDIAFADKFVSGKKSEGMMNLLTDNVVKILNEYNPITYYKIMGVLVTSFNTKEFEKLVIRTGNEL